MPQERITYLPKLRERLIEKGVDCTIISMRNAFGNFEDGPSDIELISGFTGSNGQAVVSRDSAILSVDGRYVKQAKEQTNSNEWTIKQFPDFNTQSSIAAVTSKGSKLAIAPYSISYNSYVSITRLAHDLGISVSLLDEDIMPQNLKSNNTVFLVNEENIGESIRDRIDRVRDGISEGEAVLFAEKSTIGWVFGVRLTRATSKKSVLPNCVAIIPKDGRPVIFCDLAVVDTTDVFDIKRLDEFEDVIRSIDCSCRIVCDYSTIPAYFIQTLQNHGLRTADSRNRYSEFFCIKNQTEITNQRKAAEITSLAFIRTLAFAMNERGITELDVAKFFERTISEVPGFVDLSFNCISAFGENTSIVHYIPKPLNNVPITGSGLFLFDAGAHFNNSTTDMTRTIFIGNFDEYPVSREELRKIYTTVLKSVIMFSRLRFPVNTKAYSIDSVARYEVWQAGYDYQFGTGHGVGSYGNVHEPPRISQASQHTIKEDMVFTVEPGIYQQNFGIRLENMLLTTSAGEAAGYMEFETLNHIPFCRDLIEPTMLTSSEIDWLNAYHSDTYHRSIDKLSNDSKAVIDWLTENTKEIEK
ncbi:MAG: M24 family metallopeptidase [Holosporales bacterium]|jgi:Xaa-Pro aminopeptidase|nr:M24 family metallopeptidase [Holosporales bacterium]